jgi:hypothetical protein
MYLRRWRSPRGWALGVGVFGCSAALAVACARDAANDGDPPGADQVDGGSTPEFAGTSDAKAPCRPSADNFDIPGNGCDDDADGQIDNVPASCDQGLAVEGDAALFSRALGFCRASADGKHGIVSAAFTNGFGLDSPPGEQQHGILPGFGAVVKPIEGGSLGVISTGWARPFNGAEGRFQFKGGEKMQLSTGAVPPGFPRTAEGCNQGDAPVFDVISFRVTLKVPANAQGLSFKVNFFSSEWPEFVCTRYNDGFAAMVSSKAVLGGTPTNVSYDAQKNLISVNNGFFDRCTPNAETGCAGDPPVLKTSACAAGVAELAGTGFGQPSGKYCGPNSQTASPGGATGWLKTVAPVSPNETMTLEFILWDTGDQSYDSSILLDDFQWEEGSIQIPETTRIR